jgi:hypothetical protein
MNGRIATAFSLLIVLHENVKDCKNVEMALFGEMGIVFRFFIGETQEKRVNVYLTWEELRDANFDMERYIIQKAQRELDRIHV